MQKPSCRGIPQNPAQKQPEKIPQADIAPADGKAVKDPQSGQPSEENQIRRPVPPAAQGAQKPVKQSRGKAQKTGRGKAARGYGRGRHPRIRRSQPPGRGSS